EPSACAAFEGPVRLCAAGKEYFAAHGIQAVMDNALHICWATGGSLVPEDIRNEYINTYM
ncbi:MAG: D-serine ammonia-lyase, partial [Clostridia bacterium]|nr:D-serine ammonia-lyase [Clostridia bacterium]